MPDSLINKVKSILDSAFVSKFDTNDMESEKYIPLCIYKGSVCVIATPETNQNNVKTKVVEK